MEELDGLRALVTGGGSGIGAAIAARLVRGGAKVLVVDLDPAYVAKTRATFPVLADRRL